MNKDKKSHGLYLSLFDQSEQTLDDFIKCFKIGRRAILNQYKKSSSVEVLDLLFDKDDYVIRNIRIEQDIIPFKFKKYTEEDEDFSELIDIVYAIQNKRDSGGY